MKIKSISYLTKIPYLLCFFCVSGRESIDFSPFGVVVVFLTHSVTPSQHFVKLQKPTNHRHTSYTPDGWEQQQQQQLDGQKKKRNSVGWGFSYFISLHIGDGADDGCRGGCGCVCGTGPAEQQQQQRRRRRCSAGCARSKTIHHFPPLLPPTTTTTTVSPIQQTFFLI
jgi:hypothetical protein